MTWVCQPESGAGTQSLTSCCFRALGSPFSLLGQLDTGSAGDRGAELSLASEPAVAAPPLPTRPGRPFLPGCTEPSVRLSKDRAYFFPSLLRPSPHWRDCVMQMSWIGSAPAGDSRGSRRTGCLWSAGLSLWN